MKESRLVYKVSGESLLPAEGSDRDVTGSFQFVVDEIVSLVQMGNEVVVVVGGGNIFRGSDKDTWKMTQREADETGMIATVLNAMRLGPRLGACGVKTCVLAPSHVTGLVSPWSAPRAQRYLGKGGVVIVAGGVGLPNFSSDYAAVYYAVEVGASRVLVAKSGTDAVYDEDPNVNPSANRLTEVSGSSVIRMDLKVMDLAAIDLARRAAVRINVFGAGNAGCARRIMEGGLEGTVITPG